MNVIIKLPRILFNQNIYLTWNLLIEKDFTEKCVCVLSSGSF